MIVGCQGTEDQRKGTDDFVSIISVTVGCVRGVTCLLLPIDRDARRDDAEGDTDTHAPVKDFKEVIFQLLSECS